MMIIKPTLGNENEMIILMKNMNRLSSKMMSMSSTNGPEKPSETTIDGLSAAELNEYEEELDLHDLNDSENLQYIKLNINTDIAKEQNLIHMKDQILITRFLKMNYINIYNLKLSKDK